jgi:uncharacterized membrane protein YdjX (TVP38/TMEM64 family)
MRAQGHLLPRRVLLLGGLLVLCVVGCGVAVAKGWTNPKLIRDTVSRAGDLALPIYFLAAVVCQFFWFPRLSTLIAAGALFGPVTGALVSALADLTSGAFCYLIASKTGQNWTEEQLAKRPRTRAAITQLARRRGIATVALLRVCPVAHFTSTSWAAGIAGVSPLAFIVGTALGIIPGALLYPYLGDTMLDPTSPAFVAALLLALVGLLITGVAGRKALRAAEDRA